MASRTPDSISRAIAHRARPWIGADEDFDPILDLVGDASLILIGEATHGTQEFCRQRIRLTRRLIEEKGFRAVAIEAGWPAAYRVNRFVRGLGKDATALQALQDFPRFPAWMWRNSELLDFLNWLRTRNDRLQSPEQKTGFYGLDLYSMYGSVAAVIEYLARTDPQAAERARRRYAWFEQFGVDPKLFGLATSLGVAPVCERDLISQLVELRHRRGELLVREGITEEDTPFQVEQDAQVMAREDRYYRAMFSGHVSSWNFRDTHMADSLDALFRHLGRKERAKVVVWAHNSHVGDARATEMGKAGQLNIGQLARERHPGMVRLIGFSTYTGTVTAASVWGEAAERMHVHPAIPGSYEDLFHHSGCSAFLLTPSDFEHLKALREPHLERAIGAVYWPQTERLSHYFYSDLPAQFDAVVHFDTTHALAPLEAIVGWKPKQVPETHSQGV
jgi:erythromycin esterase-like protein